MSRTIAAVRAGRRESEGGRVRFTAAARQAALEHVAARRRAGASLKAAAAEIGIAYETARRWLERQPAVRPVRVIADQACQAPVVVLPGGARIEGLDVASLAELVRRLS